jgi:GT2 family glycosyltransferase
MPVTVAVVVPCHRPSPAFERCLASIARLDPQPDEVVVVADGADPGVVALAAGFGARVVCQTPRSGPAVARNQGVGACGSDVVLFLDADVEASPDLVARVRRWFSDPDVAAVIGSYDDSPSEPGLASQYKNLLNHHVHQHAKDEGFTFWGACGAIRRATFLAVGGFDEEYAAPSIEDIELGYRLRAAGFRIRVDKAMQVKHLKRWTPWSLLKTDVVHRALPWSALILRTGRMEDDLNVGVSERIKSALVLLAVGALAAAPRWAPAAAVAAACVAVVVAMDRPLLGFLARRGGYRLAAFGAAWHLLYHLYAAAGYLAAAARHLVFGTHPVGLPWPGSPRRWTGDGPAPALVDPLGEVIWAGQPGDSAPPALRLGPPGGTWAGPGGTWAGPGGTWAGPGGVVRRAVAGRPPGAVATTAPSPQRSGPVVVEIKTRVAQASVGVDDDKMYRRSSRFRHWAPVVGFLAVGAALLPAYRHEVHVDGLSYLRIAQYYAAGDLAAAVNPYWGPLYSWLVVPYLWLGLDPLLASKAVQLSIGAGTVLAIRRLCLACGLRTATADGMALATIPLVVHLVYLNVFADLLVALLLLAFCVELIRRDEAAPVRGAALAGGWGGLAFLAKPYALAVVVVSVLAVAALRVAAGRGSPARPAVGPPRLAAVTLAAAAAVVAPWVVALSLAEGRPTVSHSVGYNLAVIAPGSAGVPLATGLVEPPAEGALFAWEEPSTMALQADGWTSVGAGVERLASNVAGNVATAAKVVAGQFLVVAALAATGGWWVLRNTRRLDSPWAALAVVTSVYCAGYVLTLVEGRYLWFAVLALIPFVGYAIDGPYLRPALTPAHRDYAPWRLAGFAVFAVALSVQAALALPWQPEGRQVAALAEEVRAAAGASLAGSRLASNGEWEATSALCFHLGCTYLGVARPGPGWEELARHGVDHYVAWPSGPRVPAGDPPSPVSVQVGDVAVFGVSP